jgi:hypothetical protein
MRADSFQRGRLACGSLLAIAVIIGCTSDPASASDQPTSVPHPVASACAFGAFVQEDDPAGLNVRATPSASGAILGTLPPSFTSRDNPGFKVRIEVDVVGQQDGWFHVVNARDNDQLTGLPARKLAVHEGWVSGRKLTIKSQASRGHASPDARSATVMSLDDADTFDGDAIVGASHLVACRGIWVQIELDPARLPADVRSQLHVQPAAADGSATVHPRAWVDQICGVQETTCEGQGGN